jgi:predicted Zn-dependent peptidase
MKRLIAVFVLACLVVSAGMADDKKPGYVEYTEYKLDNGLRVILSEDHSVPIVAVNVWYHVGSGYEEPGRSGFAHLFEHMMFEGSENVGKTEHMKYVSTAGGSMNGSTTQDRTNYFETLPANRLNLGLWLEADRMRSLAITEENFENQRETVKEERRQRVDNEPYGAAFLVSDTLNYDWPPYSHTVIGKMVDLDAAEVSDVQAFFDKYYKPSNAVLVVVGDIDQKKTMKMVEEYFSDIPGAEPIPKLTGEGDMNKGERREIVDSPKANVPAVFIGYVCPPHNDADTPALQLLNSVLVDGESSRMHKRLVKDEEAAFAVFGFHDGRLGPSLFRLIGAANAGVDIDVVEGLMQEEIEKVQTEGISEEELEKVKIQWKKNFITGRQTCMQKAEALQHYALFHDDLAEINSDIDRYMAVTTEDIQRVANEYLQVGNRTVVIAAPPSKESS